MPSHHPINIDNKYWFIDVKEANQQFSVPDFNPFQANRFVLDNISVCFIIYSHGKIIIATTSS
jgi:hypothetical protein